MKINKAQKELVKVYIFLFILIFIATNWGNVSWMFNYRAVSGLAYDFFNPYQDSPLLVSTNGIAFPVANAAGIPLPMVVKSSYSDRENSLEIPSLDLVTPLVIGQSTDISALQKDLDKGVVYYPGSVLPSQVGQIAILGHSAPPNWPKIKYDWVFTKINDLNNGDQIILYFNNRQYTYKVIDKNIIQAGEDVGANGLNGKNNILALVSCWPPGKNYKRIVVYAELVIN